jgi:hypothetical protein
VAAAKEQKRCGRWQVWQGGGGSGGEGSAVHHRPSPHRSSEHAPWGSLVPHEAGHDRMARLEEDHALRRRRLDRRDSHGVLVLAPKDHALQIALLQDQRKLGGDDSLFTYLISFFSASPLYYSSDLFAI